MFTPEMLESIKKVEATRQTRLGVEPRRMTAEEKDSLLKQYHPDYKESGFAQIKVGPKQRAESTGGAGEFVTRE